MKKLFYITYQTFPGNTANTIQSIANLKYFVRNSVQVKLFFPIRSKESRAEIKSLQKFYNFTEEFEVHGLDHPFPFGKYETEDSAFTLSLYNKFLFLYSHMLWSLKAVRHVLKKIEKPDVFFTRSDWVLFFLSLYKQNVIFECHQYSKIRNLLIKLSLKSNKTKVIFVNNQLPKTFNLDEKNNNNLLVLHNGFEEDLFQKNIEKIKNQIIFSGNISRFSKDRGINLIIKSFKNSRLFEKYKLKIIGGSQNDIEKINNLVKELELDTSIEILGKLDRKKTIEKIQESDIGLLINSSNSDSSIHTSPLKYFEYLRSGLNIVAVDLPAHRELPLSENISFYKEDDEQSFISSLNKLEKEKNKTEIADINIFSVDNRVKKIIKFSL